MPAPGPTGLTPDRTGKSMRDPASGRTPLCCPQRSRARRRRAAGWRLRRANRTEARRCQPTAHDSHRWMSKLLTLVTYVNKVARV